MSTLEMLVIQQELKERIRKAEEIRKFPVPSRPSRLSVALRSLLSLFARF
jgi:hypothetical protein